MKEQHNIIMTKILEGCWYPVLIRKKALSLAAVGTEIGTSFLERNEAISTIPIPFDHY